MMKVAMQDAEVSRVAKKLVGSFEGSGQDPAGSEGGRRERPKPPRQRDEARGRLVSREMEPGRDRAEDPARVRIAPVAGHLGERPSTRGARDEFEFPDADWLDIVAAGCSARRRSPEDESSFDPRPAGFSRWSRGREPEFPAGEVRAFGVTSSPQGRNSCEPITTHTADPLGSGKFLPRPAPSSCSRAQDDQAGEASARPAPVTCRQPSFRPGE